MNRLPAQLAALQAALVPPSGSGPVPAALHGDIDALIRAIRRKGRFVEMHMALLVGIEGNQIDELGRRSSGVTDPTRLKIPLSEASLIIEHPGAVIDHVYLAFDGLIAAVVNMTDTLGRLVNVAYSLGINPRKSTLLAVRDRCNATSSLGVVLNDSQYTDWLRKLRDLRGRCQHADIEESLTSSTGCSFAQRAAARRPGVFLEKPCATNADGHVRRGGCSGGGGLPTRHDRRSIGEPGKPHRMIRGRRSDLRRGALRWAWMCQWAPEPSTVRPAASDAATARSARRPEELARGKRPAARRLAAARECPAAAFA